MARTGKRGKVVSVRNPTGRVRFGEDLRKTAESPTPVSQIVAVGARKSAREQKVAEYNQSFSYVAGGFTEHDDLTLEFGLPCRPGFMGAETREFPSESSFQYRLGNCIA